MTRDPGTSGPVVVPVTTFITSATATAGGLSGARVMLIEARTKNNRYRKEECTIIGMVVDVSTTKNGHRIADIQDTSAPSWPVLSASILRMLRRLSTMK